MTTIAMILDRGELSEPTVTALGLAERLLARGHRVSVFAHDEAAVLCSGRGPAARIVEALLRRGVHGATLDWVVEADAAEALGLRSALVSGVVAGDHSDLWGFVRDADVVLTPQGGSG